MDLSSQHRCFFRQPNDQSLTRLQQFFIDVYQADKWRELLSYMRWEVNHRIGLFPKSQHLTFDDHLPVVLTGTTPIPVAFALNTVTCARQAPLPWRMFQDSPASGQFGCLFTDESGLYVSQDGGLSAERCYVFPHPIQSMFQSMMGHLFVCSRGVVYRSIDRGKSFQHVMSFSSPTSYFLFNNGMTGLPNGRLLIGEYDVVQQKQTWQNVAYVYYSTNQGETWQQSDFLIRDGVNKHVHFVKYSLHLNALVLTDGDNKKQVWLNRSLTSVDRAAGHHRTGWQRLNHPHYQTGGYLSMVSVNGTVLFGSDYLGGTNFMVSTQDGTRLAKRIVPDPYRRSPVTNMITRRTRSGTAEIWAVLHNSIDSTTRCLLMYSADAGTTWTKVLDYDGTYHEIKLVSSALGAVDRLYIAIITKQESGFRHTVFNIIDSPAATASL